MLPSDSLGATAARRESPHKETLPAVQGGGCKGRDEQRFIVWHCENCDFSSGLEVSKCIKCNSTMKKLEHTMDLEDEELIERESMVSLNISGSFTSCTEEPAYYSPADDTQGMEQTQNDNGMATTTCGTPEPSFVIAIPIQMVDLQMQHQEKDNSCISGQTYSKPVSEFNLPSLVDLSLDTEFEMYRRQRDIFSSMLEDTKKVQDSGAQISSSDTIVSKMENQDKKVKPDVGLLLEYQSTSGYSVSCPSMCGPPLEVEDTFKTHQGSQVLQSMGPNSEASKNMATGGLNNVENLEETSVTSTCVSIDSVTSAICIQTERSRSGEAHTMHHTGWDALNCEEQVLPPFPGAPFLSKLVEPLSEHEAEGRADMTYMILSDLTNTSQISEKVEVYGESVEDLNNNRELEDYENPCTQPWQQYAMESMQLSIGTRESSPDMFEDSFQSALSASSSFESLRNSRAFDDPTISVTEDRPSCGDVVASLSAADGLLVQADCPDRASQCPTVLHSAAGDAKVTVSQMVDVSSDFRMCFTTTRSTSMERPLVSRANNTEVTLIKKCSSKRWQTIAHRSIACNTDCSSVQTTVQEVGSQTISADTQEKLVSTDITTPDWNLLAQDSVQLRESTLHLKENPQRIKEVYESAESPPSSPCCLQVLERAVKAELQLLNTYYRMCRDHCWRMCRLAMEERGSFNSDLPSSCTEMCSAIFPSLEELKRKYEILKEKLLSGTPLDDLPQLSVEEKNKLAFTDYIPSEILKADIQSDVRRLQSGLGIHIKEDIKNSTLTQHVSLTFTPQPTALSESGHITHDKSYLEAEFVSIDENKIKDSDRTQDGNEGWFDAKEELTLNQTCVTLPTDQQEPGLETVPTVELKAVETSGCEPKRGLYVHVGGLSPSTSEDELRSTFLKYQVSEIFLEQFSLRCSYAIIFFNTAHRAQLAVQEMDGKEISGKGVKVRLIKVSEETISSHHAFENNMDKKDAVSASNVPSETCPPLNPLTMDSSSKNLAAHAVPSQELPAEGRLSSDPLTVSGLAPHSDPAVHPSKPVNSSFHAGPQAYVTNTPLSWKATSSTSNPWIMPNLFPLPWSISSSYPTPYWQVPCSNAGPWVRTSPTPYNWPTPTSFQSPWPGPSSTQIPLSSQGYPHVPWSLPSFPPGSWPLSSAIPHAFGFVKTSPKLTSSSNTTSKLTVVTSTSSEETVCSATPSKGPSHTAIPLQTICLGPFQNTGIASGPFKVNGLSTTPSTVTNSAPTHSNEICFAVAPTTVTDSVFAHGKHSSAVTLPKVTIKASELRKVVTSTAPPSKVTSCAPPTTTRVPTNCTPSTKTCFCSAPASSIVSSSIAALTTVTESVYARGKVTYYAPTFSHANSSAVTSITVTTSSASAAKTKTQSSSQPLLVMAKNPIQTKSEPCTPSDPAPFIPQKTVNLDSLCKLLKKLADLHPQANRTRIMEALADVRANNNGSLNGLPLDTIVEKASSVLAQSATLPEAKK